MKALRSRIRLGIFVVVVIAVGVAGFVVYNKLAAESSDSGPARTVAVKQGMVLNKITAPGTVAMSQSQVLSAKGTVGSSVDVKVAVGDKVVIGQLLAKFDSTALKTSVRQAEVNLDTAKARLEQALTPYQPTDIALQKSVVEMARAKLRLAEQPYDDEDIAVAESAVRKATYDLEQSKLNQVIVQKSAAVALDPRTAQNEFNWYESNYGQTLQRYQANRESKEKLDGDYAAVILAKEKLETARTKAHVATNAAQAQIYQLTDALQLAQAKLDKINAGSEPQTVQDAQAVLGVAEAKLALMLPGPDSLSIRTAQNAVDLAQINADNARLQLEAVTLVAPFDSTVIVVTSVVGDSTIPTSVSITIADLNKMQVNGSVNEIDVARIKMGQTAQVKVDAFTNRPFAGKVLKVDTIPTMSQGIVNYGITVILDESGGVLKPGMTASAILTADQRNDVLVVPIEAVRENKGSFLVDVQEPDGIVRVREISIGLSDEKNVEVVTGLEAEELVALPKIGSAIKTADKKATPAPAPKAPNNTTQPAKQPGK
ncbi:MAG: efflux RND transporter periplasmic adaptor subunit [Dehalococcoidia bacterium]|nr:efflux RND transporter periplasmic adaptor subunit [Dehalococcoidia bacterium]